MFKTTLTYPDRQALMFVLVSALLLERYQTGQEMFEDDHGKVMSKWLAKNDRKASLITKAKFLSISSRFYKQLVRTQSGDNIGRLCEELSAALSADEPPPLAGQLMKDCTQLLHEHGLDR